MKYNYLEFKSLEITEAEVAAVQRYISSQHISMNALLEIEPDVLAKLSKKGWFIDFSKEGMKTNIECLEKLYSAMYKYSRARGPLIATLYRGTTMGEIEKIAKNKNYGRCISTATDEDVAMRFTEYGNGALIKISPNSNVPYIRMEDFLAESQVSEEEVLLAPFCNVSSITEYSNIDIDGVKSYGIGVNKMEYERLSQDDRQNCESTIFETDLGKEIEEYDKLSSELDILNERISKITPEMEREDPQMKEYYINKQHELVDRVNVVAGRISNVKNSMNKYLQDRFRHIEINIEKEIFEEEKTKDEHTRKAKIEEARDSKQKLLDKADVALKKLEQVHINYIAMKDEDRHLNILAKQVGISGIDDSKESTEIENKFEQLKENIQILKNKIYELEILDSAKDEDFSPRGKIQSEINDRYSELEMTLNVLHEGNSAITSKKEYDSVRKEQKVIARVMDSISIKMVSELYEKRGQLEAKKDSLWDKITGKSKIKASQIKNLDLRISYIKDIGVSTPKDLNELGMFLKKYSCVVGEDKLTKEANVILQIQAGTEEVPIITPEDEQQLGAYVVPKALAVGKMPKKEVLRHLACENEKLRETLQKTNGEFTNHSEMFVNLNDQTIDRHSIEDYLNTALFYTGKDGMTEEKKKEAIENAITV